MPTSQFATHSANDLNLKNSNLCQQKEITGVHLNIQCISNKIPQLEVLLNKEKPQFLLLSEHWMSPDQAAVTGFPGYRLLSHFCRTSSIHGGVAIFGQDNIPYKQIKLPKQLVCEFLCECAGISLSVNKAKIALLVFYRSPDNKCDVNLFLNYFNSIICLVLKKHKYIIICGDINIDYLTDNVTRRLLSDIFDSFDLKSSLPVEPTRHFNNSISAIDYVISNLPNIKSQNLDLDISDHKAQKFSVAFSEPQQPSSTNHKYCYKRIFSDSNLFNLTHLLSTTDLGDLYLISDVNQAWQYFWGNILYCLDLTCPTRKIKIRGEDLEKNWIDSRIIAESQNLKNLYWLSKNMNNTKINEEYKIAKKKYSDMLKSQKQNFYENKIKKSSNTSQEIWTIVNSNLGRCKNESNVSQIINNNNFISDPNDICNLFCTYFAEIAINSLNNIYNNLDGDCSTGTESLSSLFFYDITPEEIDDQLSLMQNKSSSGPDGIPIKVLKYISQFIVHPLCYIFNLSVKSGIFPNDLKMATVIPLHKKGDADLIENYRPITLPSCFSKLFEKIIHCRIYTFINEKKLLSSSQHGFRPNLSTNTASFSLTNAIYNALDKGEYVLTLFFDLTRAFDCVNKNFIIRKLENLGIREPLNDWIYSFLSDRIIRVKIGEHISQPAQINLGVPQGSVLSPLLFLLFINDLEQHIADNVTIVLYADDTTICITAPSPEELQSKVNYTLHQFYTWCANNKLIINATKTKYVMFHKRREDPHIVVKLNNTTIDKVHSVKFLGLHLDEQLTWSNHIEHVAKKLNSAYFAIRNLRSVMDTKYLLNIYFALAYSHMKYLIIYWGTSCEFQRIFIHQKKIIRLIFSLNPLQSCRQTFIQNKIFSLPCILIYEAALFVKLNKAHFPLHNSVHDHDTRGCSKIYINKFNLSCYKKGPFYLCGTIFNKLPTVIKQETNINRFKKKLRLFLCENCFYSLQEFYNFNVVS